MDSYSTCIFLYCNGLLFQSTLCDHFPGLSENLKALKFWKKKFQKFFSLKNFNCKPFFQVPVPSINTYCAPKSNSSLELVAGRVVKMFWSAGIEQLRPRELCGDLIVSGHTLTIFTAFLVFKTYAPQRLQVIFS